jgi:hypothetical protein
VESDPAINRGATLNAVGHSPPTGQQGVLQIA